MNKHRQKERSYRVRVTGPNLRASNSLIPQRKKEFVHD